VTVARERPLGMTRREWLIGGGILAASARRVIAQMAHMAPMPQAPPLFEPREMTPFVDPLPIPDVMRPVGTRLNSSGKPVPYYNVPIQEFFGKIHRDVPPTRFWGYGKSVPGPTIEARSGEEIRVEWSNRLPSKHFLPIDHTLMGAGKGRPDSRAVVHVHGARVPPASDGWPEQTIVPGESAICTYPNQQEPALLWYHDHAMGINRLNVCAGMAGLYVIRDAFEDSLNLPSGEYEIPLVLMDRMIRTDGQIYYPVSPVPDAPWMPEYSGNATLVNGTLLPYLDVKPRKYRFRILNASNARFYFLSLDEGQVFQQIGTDQGLLPAPVAVGRLELAPGERADVVLDFADHRGRRIVLHNQSFTLMRFNVASDAATDTSALPKTLRAVPKIAESTAVMTRRLSLVEVDNVLSEPSIHLLDGKRWHEPISEKPVLDTTEIWEFFNLTEDVHPIHLHLVRFQILDRRPIDVSTYVYDKKTLYTGDAAPPEPGEAGWKDTVRVTPEASTRILVKFEGYTGRYVWHCHILEHEDNEMMRPYEVIAPARK